MLQSVIEREVSRLPVSELVVAWPVQVPAHIPGGMAASIERERALVGRYPIEWPGVAWLVKTIAGWTCERCSHPHDPDPRTGFVLTVHHLDGNKANLQHWNLAALCQKCHLRIQNRVNFNQDWPFEHSPWMAVHVADYNEWAVRQPCPVCRGLSRTRLVCLSCSGSGHLPLLSLIGIAERSYANEWPA
jgi:hypothetical protein